MILCLEMVLLGKGQLRRRQWRCSGVFIVNFEQISHIPLVLTLK